MRARVNFVFAMLRAARVARTLAPMRLARTLSFDALPDEEDSETDEKSPGRVASYLVALDEPMRNVTNSLVNNDYTLPGIRDAQPEIPAEVVEGGVITNIVDSISDIVKSLGE